MKESIRKMILAKIAPCIFAFCVSISLTGCADMMYAMYKPSDFSGVAMPDPNYGTWYDNDYAFMLQFYSKYVESYAKMNQVLAEADQQYAIADNLARQINSINADGTADLQKVNELSNTIDKSVHPSVEKINRANQSAKIAEERATAYATQATNNFNYAVSYAKAICKRYHKDYEKHYGNSGHVLYHGPAYDLPLPVQENMRRIKEIACIIRAMNGRRNFSAISDEIASWFTSSSNNK